MKLDSDVFRVVASIKWPTTNINVGIAHGWEGAAWITLDTADKGAYKISSRLLRKIEKRADQRLKIDTSKYCGELLGDGGLVSVLEGANKLMPQQFSDQLQRAYAKYELCVTKSKAFDLYSGSAGMLITLLQMGSQKKYLLKLLFDRTVWYSENKLLKDKTTYLGYAHGIMGFLFALEAAVHVGGFREKKNIRAQLRDLLWQQSVDVGELDVRWPQFKVNEVENAVFMNSWCNGNSGISLGAAQAWQLSKNKEYLEIFKASIRAFDSKPNAAFLCCGVIGNSLVLHEILKHSNLSQKSILYKTLEQQYRVHKTAVKKISASEISGLSFWRGVMGHQFFEIKTKNSALSMPSSMAFFKLT